MSSVVIGYRITIGRALRLRLNPSLGLGEVRGQRSGIVATVTYQSEPLLWIQWTLAAHTKRGMMVEWQRTCAPINKTLSSQEVQRASLFHTHTHTAAEGFKGTARCVCKQSHVCTCAESIIPTTDRWKRPSPLQTHMQRRHRHHVAARYSCHHCNASAGSHLYTSLWRFHKPGWSPAPRRWEAGRRVRTWPCRRSRPLLLLLLLLLSAILSPPLFSTTVLFSSPPLALFSSFTSSLLSSSSCPPALKVCLEAKYLTSIVSWLLSFNPGLPQ